MKPKNPIAVLLTWSAVTLTPAHAVNAAGRNYQIEQLGTANLVSVELIKAPQPEQDANAVAGFVNLVSRRAFDLPGRPITVTGGAAESLQPDDEVPQWFVNQPASAGLGVW
mgnify:CR=1 FL=1